MIGRTVLAAAGGLLAGAAPAAAAPELTLSAAHAEHVFIMDL